MTTDFEVSVIVPTKNSDQTLKSCLQSLHNQTKAVQIIVVDNFSQDKTPQIAKKYSDIFLQKGPERSAQRNFGLKHAQGRFVLFIDSDMELTSKVIEACLHKATDQKALIIPERVPGRSLYCRARNMEKKLYDQNIKISAARFFPRQAILKIGGWNEKMNSTEDWELQNRFLQAGHQVDFIKPVIYHHEADLSFWKAVAKKIGYARQLKKQPPEGQASGGEVSPFYRLGLLFSRPDLALRSPLVFVYMVALKINEFGWGYLALKLLPAKK